MHLIVSNMIATIMNTGDRWNISEGGPDMKE